MTDINWKVFLRAFCCHWNCENHWRINGDMAKWICDRITFYSSLSSSPEDVHKHIQHLNKAFHQFQNSPHNAAVVVDSRVKKFNVAHAIAHIWYNNHIVKQLKCWTMNVTSVKAELMAIHIGLISVMENNDMHNNIVATVSGSAPRFYSNRRGILDLNN